MKPPPSTIARFIADDYFAACDPDASADARMTLATRIETALRAAIAEERAACAELCEKREALWHRTEEQQPASPLRPEARARSAEAAYLRDAIRVRGDERPGERR